MEKKANTPIIGLAVAVVSVIGFVGCGIFCFTLSHSLRIQRDDLTETRAQMSALREAVDVQRHDLAEARAQLATAKQRIVGAQKMNPTRNQQLTDIRSNPHPSNIVSATPHSPMQLPPALADVPAVDSVEGKLQAEGRNWERTQGQPIPSGYVLDIMEGRLNQPKGRGRIGTVVSVAANEEGRPVATVDFGHGYIVGIAASELAPVRILAPDVR